MRIFKLSTLLAFLMGCQAAWSDPIFFEADDLGDGDASTWQYNYTVGNETDGDIDWFTIFFDPLLYVFDLIIVPGGFEEVDPNIFTGPAEWDIFVAPPDDFFGFLEDGFYDGFALGDVVVPGDLVGGFSIEFTWLGALGTTPGSQPFTLFGDGLPDNPTLFTQQRVVSVPEPGTLALFGIGLLALGFSRRRPNQNWVTHTTR